MDPHSEIRAFIADVRRRWRRQLALRTAGLAAAVAAVPLVLAEVVDVVLVPAGDLLIGLAFVTLVAAAAAGVWIISRMRRRPDDAQVARFIEERAAAVPGGQPADDGLVSAVDLLTGGDDTHGRAAFAPLIAARAVRRLGDITALDIVTSAQMQRSAGHAAAGMLVLAAVLGLGAPGIRRAMDTLRMRYFPQSVQIDVSPGNARVAAGSALRIHATIRGVRNVAPSLAVSASGQQRVVTMVRAGDGFEYAFESVDRSFGYRVTAGSAHSADYAVTALHPPRVTAIDLRYEFPSFADLAPREDLNAGDIYGPAGTRVRVRVHTDKPVATGALALSGAAALDLRAAGDRLLEADLVLRADGGYRVTLADDDGLRASGDTEYFIRLMDDRPPDVRILRPSTDSEITPLEEVTIEARADDDYGIASFDLVYAVGGGPERSVRFDRVTGTGIQKIGSRLIAAEDLGVKPGDVITYYARARDVGRGKHATEARSDIYFLEVKPFAEEFVAAQSQVGGAAAAQIESLIEAQKEIISATWNVERRAQAGRSTQDVRAIAQAQADLKARAEQMSGRSVRGRQESPAPQRVEQARAQTPGRAAQGDPMGTAVEGMARATAQLQDQKTKDALPHEMAALNGLLQAQAEVRRRQVTQATGGSGGAWGNRQGQDLSALFDKELQRQQRTNYESQSPVETRPEAPGSRDAAADRVRDLARRQEELNRRQRDLASAGLAADERKRQLEKLTRDQAELRKQAEQLARDLSTSGRGSQTKGASPQGTQPQGLRGASDDMRSAGGELDRDDPKAAAASGERAVQQLRRAEQQLRDGSPAGTPRPGSDLQVEAQQIAAEQRRIATEASRLQENHGADPDAARRLATEKDRLAGRVGELRQSAEQRAAGQGTDAKNLADASRTIDRERISQRMRESANRIRQGAQGQPAVNASTEQQIAEAVERVADALGGSSSAETRQLSDQLSQTRALRDRLDSLERQMREADAQRGTQPGRTGQAPRGSAEGSGGGQGSQAAELQRLQQEYQRELERARQALGQAGGGGPQNGIGGTPEQHEFSRSAPGTESFKQDRSGWESLRHDVDAALERREASVSDRLARVRAAERFAAGGSERVPDSYRRRIAKYYEALAKAK